MWVVFAYLLSPALTVGAESATPKLALQIESCVKIDAAEVGRVVAAELRAAILPDSPDANTRVTVGCRGAFYQVRVDEPESQKAVVDTVFQRKIIELRADDFLTGKSLRRSVDLNAEAPMARARLLGLAVSELVRASWMELAVEPPPEVTPMDVVASPLVQSLVRNRVETTDFRHVASSCGAASFPMHRAPWLAVCGADLLYAGELWQGGIDVDFGAGKMHHALGSVGLSRATIFPHFGANVRAASLSASFDVGARLGAMTLSGHAKADNGVLGNAETSAWGGPAARLSAQVWPSNHFGLGLYAEAGFALLGSQGLVLGKTVVDTSALWVGGGLSVTLGY